MYHNIAKPPKGKRLTSLYTSPKLFSFQMRLLSLLGYRGLSIKDLKPYLNNKKTGKVFGITFDDGYKDNLINALPVLKKVNFTATCYIVSAHLGESNVWTQNQNVEKSPLMTSNEVQTWIDSGMSIGSHSHTHAHLCKIAKEDMIKEILESKKILEETFHLFIEDFCFPYGEYNQTCLDELKKAGYLTATTTERGRFSSENSLLKIPRIHMTKRTYLASLLLKLFTSYEDRRYKEFHL